MEGLFRCNPLQDSNVCIRTKHDSCMDSKDLRRQPVGLAVWAWSLVMAEDARRLFSGVFWGGLRLR